MNTVRREGDTVVRSGGPWTPTIHRYLDHLHAKGIDGIPRPLGFDGVRETLSFVDGTVPAYPLPTWAWTDEALVEAAQKLRSLHDASEDFDTVGGLWQSAWHGPAEVICHNDFAPHNLAFRNGDVVGVIDFDMASPGPRSWDLAYLATRMVPLTTERHAGAVGEDQWMARIRLMLDAYESEANASEVVSVAITRLGDLATFSRAKADELRKPELRDHAELYDRDARYLERWLSANSPG